MAYSTRKRLLCLFLLLLSANQSIKSMNTIKSVIAYPLTLSQESMDKLTAATQAINNFGDKIVDPNTWDHVTNLVFFKLFGCISAAAGFATIHQWLNSLNNNKKPATGNLLPVTEPEMRAAKKMDLLTPESIDLEDLEQEELQETQDKREQKNSPPDLKYRVEKILPPVVGSLFAITGLVFILKARSISAFFVNRWSKEKLTKS